MYFLPVLHRGKGVWSSDEIETRDNALDKAIKVLVEKVCGAQMRLKLRDNACLAILLAVVEKVCGAQMRLKRSSTRVIIKITKRGKGVWSSDEIETAGNKGEPKKKEAVEKVCGAQMRLKLSLEQKNNVNGPRGKGVWSSDEIETCSAPHPRYSWLL